MNKSLKIIIPVAILIIAGWYFFSGSEEVDEELFYTIQKSDLPIEVIATGELKAKNSINISGPTRARNVDIYNMTIEHIVPEGTIVEKGDYVARIDKTELAGKLTEAEAELEKALSQYTTVQLDTALELRSARDNLINLQYGMEESKIKVNQSKFEPPAIQRQAEIEHEKAQRAFDQAEENYKLKTKQSVAKMREITATLSQIQNEYNFIGEIAESFTILAPEDGMIIYAKDRFNGQSKIKAGSQIRVWDPTVATLPDLRKMISISYINEVDINKIKNGQKVEITIDALPGKTYTGNIFSVANIGEQLRSSDAKVFQVDIEVIESDTTLRPSMTSNNKILIETFEDVYSVPLEAVSNDSITYVYKKTTTGVVKQQVETGVSNEEKIIITKGLQQDDVIYHSTPSNATEIKEVILLESE